MFSLFSFQCCLHFSHFLLTKELYPVLVKAVELRGEARVVIISFAHLCDVRQATTTRGYRACRGCGRHGSVVAHHDRVVIGEALFEGGLFGLHGFGHAAAELVPPGGLYAGGRGRELLEHAVDGTRWEDGLLGGAGCAARGRRLSCTCCGGACDRGTAAATAATAAATGDGAATASSAAAGSTRRMPRSSYDVTRQMRVP